MALNRSIGSVIRNGYNKFERWRQYSNTRSKAKKLLHEITKTKKTPILTPELKIIIKDYAEREFGDKKYSTWLELYTEIRGEFIEGWIPEEYYAFELIPKFNPVPISLLSTIKTFDHRLFPTYSLRPIALKISDGFYTADMDKIKYPDLVSLLRRVDAEVVIKRDRGPSGKDIQFLHSSEVTETNFFGTDNYVIQPALQQHPDIDRLYNKSVNTIRVGTFLTSSGDMKVVLTIMRYGMGGSRIDNLSAGGGFISIDKKGRGGSHAYNYSGKYIGDEHPDSGYKFNQVKIPNFEAVLTACKKSHQLFPYVRYIAWDVCVTREGDIKFLEWNTRMPGFWFYEARLGPLWNKEWF